MDADENRIGDAVGDGRAFFERDENVRRARQHHGVARLFQRRAGAQRDIEREVFFKTKARTRAAVVPAVAGIEHDGRDRLQAGDQLRAQARLDDLAEVEPRDERVAVFHADGKGEPLLHAVDAGFAQARRDLQAQAAGFHGDGARNRGQRGGGGNAKFARARRAHDHRGDLRRRGWGERRGLREAVKCGDVFERHVVAPLAALHVPLRRRRAPEQRAAADGPQQTSEFHGGKFHTAREMCKRHAARREL